MLENLHQVRGKNSFSANEGQYIHEERCLPFHSDASQVRLLFFSPFLSEDKGEEGKECQLKF